MKQFFLIVSLFLSIVCFSQNEESYPVGKVTYKTLFSSRNKDTYLPPFENYSPDSDALKIIKSYKGKVQIKIVMGFWCDDSKLYVPQMLKTLSDAKWDVENDEYVKIFGVDENKQAGFEGFKALMITNVPTFIVLYDDREIGRIVEAPKSSVEKDLAAILNLIKK